MAQNQNYEGTKINDISTVPPELDLEDASVLVVTRNNQFLLPMADLITYLKTQINEP